MQLQTDPGGERVTLTLQGELNVEQARQLKSVLLQCFEKADDVYIEAESVTEADLSCLQLFCAAHRTALEERKQISFSGGCPEIFKQVAKAAGYLKKTGCDCGEERTCFWTGDE